MAETAGIDDPGDACLSLAQALDVLHDSFHDDPDDDAEPHDAYKFQHHLLQEYLAGRALARTDDLEALTKPWRWGEVSPDLQEKIASLGVADPLPLREPHGWEETALHAAAVAARADDFIARVAQRDPVLAARCARHPEVSLPTEAIQALQQRLLALSQDPAADLRTRLEAGTQLGYLGDPRFREVQGDKAHYILPPLVVIDADTYTLGSETGEEDERPAHPLTLPTFEIGQYPVTNGEWARFMEAGAYEDERWWQTEAARQWRLGELAGTEQIDSHIRHRQALKEDFEGTCRRNQATANTQHIWQSWLTDYTDTEFEQAVRAQFQARLHREPAYWYDPRFKAPTQPVVGVCWHEALAYCAWLSAQSGRHFTLPSEAMWEAAARGREARPYPWGKVEDTDARQPRANTDPWHLRQTSPVGVFVDGATPQKQLYDIAGNVWEWTTSLYQPYPIHENDQRDHLEENGTRVTRGDAWGDDSVWTRASSRDYFHPDARFNYVGFRVVCRPT